MMYLLLVLIPCFIPAEAELVLAGKCDPEAIEYFPTSTDFKNECEGLWAYDQGNLLTADPNPWCYSIYIDPVLSKITIYETYFDICSGDVETTDTAYDVIFGNNYVVLNISGNIHYWYIVSLGDSFTSYLCNPSSDCSETSSYYGIFSKHLSYWYPCAQDQRTTAKAIAYLAQWSDPSYYVEQYGQYCLPEYHHYQVVQQGDTSVTHNFYTEVIADDGADCSYLGYDNYVDEFYDDVDKQEWDSEERIDWIDEDAEESVDDHTEEENEDKGTEEWKDAEEDGKYSEDDTVCNESYSESKEDYVAEEEECEGSLDDVDDSENDSSVEHIDDNQKDDGDGLDTDAGEDGYTF